jgi:DMSO/TMAO reductase YedYZ molybdopterin-dependent catalytic subunit
MGDGATRRGFLVRGFAGIATLALAGCDSISQQPWLDPLLRSAEALTKRVQRLFAGDHALAQEFTKADIAPMFRANGTLDPGTQEYREHAQKNFADWRITVGGLVEHPLSLSMDQLRKLPARTQITRHDCVEGWSCIGEWTGAQMAHILALAQPKEQARYVVFYCADPMSDSDGDGINDSDFYYESLDMVEATHPQTLLAYGLNGQDLDIAHGAPVRVRAERQLGYKQPKYVKDIVLVDSLEKIGGGKGGYWEDQGYNWWGGI